MNSLAGDWFMGRDLNPGLIYFINPNPRQTEWQGALVIVDAGWACGHLVISPVGYLIYFPLDRNALLGEVLRSVDGIIGPLSLSRRILWTDPVRIWL